MNRRTFIETLTFAALASATHSLTAQGDTHVTASKLPRWRGFNLLEKFTERMNAPFRESDFAMMKEWGFDFVRLPLSYWCWSNPGDWKTFDEKALGEVDEAVEFGRQYGIHVNINFHRGPGYCVNPPAEPFDLWSDDTALEACAYHWSKFAERYAGIPEKRVSFDLLNEPANVPAATYRRVVERLVGAIREKDPNRLIIADGLQWGRNPVPELADLGIGQSARGYNPMQISHFKASWIRGSDTWDVPTWPLSVGGDVWDRERLARERIEPWKELEALGVGVHVGEWGAFQHTPHDVVLAWMKDSLELWEAAGWGWAMWNFRGSFGVLDSGRADVAYESYKGHQLDRRMLELIRAH